MGTLKQWKLTAKFFTSSWNVLSKKNWSITTFTRWWLIKTTKYYFSRLRVTLLCYYHIHDNEKEYSKQIKSKLIFPLRCIVYTERFFSKKCLCSPESVLVHFINFLFTSHLEWLQDIFPIISQVYFIVSFI